MPRLRGFMHFQRSIESTIEQLEDIRGERDALSE